MKERLPVFSSNISRGFYWLFGIISVACIIGQLLLEADFYLENQSSRQGKAYLRFLGVQKRSNGVFIAYVLAICKYQPIFIIAI